LTGDILVDGVFVFSTSAISLLPFRDPIRISNQTNNLLPSIDFSTRGFSRQHSRNEY